MKLTEAIRMSQQSQLPRLMSQYRRLVKPLDRRNPRPQVKAADFYCLFQWKNQLDVNAPRWKHLWFKYVYRPFNQFSRFKLGIPSYAGEDREGRLWWFDMQGAVKEEWKAISIAHSKGKNWGYAGLRLEVLADESTNIMTRFDYPATDLKTRLKYWEHVKPLETESVTVKAKAAGEGR